MLRRMPQIACRCLILVPSVLTSLSLQAAEPTALRLLIAGEYERCIAAAAVDSADQPDSEPLYVVKARAELTLGRTEAAHQTLEAGLKQCPESIRLRLLQHRVLSGCDAAEDARGVLAEIDRRARKSPWRYTSAEDLVALGEAALIGGAHPRQILDDFFERARNQSSEVRDAWLACGLLRLDLEGPEAAVRFYEEALRRFPDDPDFYFGLARATVPSDPEKAATHLARALELNPRHVPSLLFDADRLISTERWTEARDRLDAVFAVNPRESEAWALRAVLAHLQNDTQEAARCRKSALAGAPQNPTIDHLIGLKLSQHYRFHDAADCQRRALEIDPNFVPAKIQLSQDLLRLGDEDGAWQLAEEASHQVHGHPAVMNLLELRERIGCFRTLEDEHFVLRMDSREAEIYGERVLAVLNRARETLGEKYDVDLSEKIIVEIFPDEADFAVRSFGMPSPAGYLAVCFGRVITAGSPAARSDQPVNWEAVLWHEFCHTVTLDVTNHQMPRWLSEGISVYEERQENPAWGQPMTPRFRAAILEGELIPIARMGEAFAAPGGPEQLQFAYFQAAMFVDFVVSTYGFDSLLAVLGDLGAGLTFDIALERRTVPLAELECQFTAFAERRAQQSAPDADWSPVDLGSLTAGGGSALEEWIDEHPRNLMALLAFARDLMLQGEFQKAKQPLQRLIELDPGQIGPNSAYALLARVHRELGEAAEEREVLRTLVEREGSALTPCRRLLELELEASDWQTAIQTAQRILAINPLLPEPYRAMARAAEQLGRTEQAAEARRILARVESGGDSAPSAPIQAAAKDRAGPNRE